MATYGILTRHYTFRLFFSSCERQRQITKPKTITNSITTSKKMPWPGNDDMTNYLFALTRQWCLDQAMLQFNMFALTRQWCDIALTRQDCLDQARMIWQITLKRRLKGHLKVPCNQPQHQRKPQTWVREYISSWTILQMFDILKNFGKWFLARVIICGLRARILSKCAI